MGERKKLISAGRSLPSCAVWFAVLACLALMLGPALARAVTCTAEVDRNKVSPGDQITLKITIAGDFQSAPPPVIPAIGGVVVSPGGTSQSFSFVNGETSATVITTYYLSVRTDRSFTIPALEVSAGGRAYRTQPIPVTVTPGATPGAPQSAPGAAAGSGSPGAKDDALAGLSSGGGAPGDEIFITLTADKTDAFVGEQIVLTFRFHRRKQLWDSPQYSTPRTEGFWREDLQQNREFLQIIAGYRYNVTEIRYALFPTRPGRLTIEPATVSIEADVFDRFFSTRRGSSVPRRLQTAPIVVNVEPLPTSGPASFSGIVARDVQLKASLDRDSVPRGEPAGLKVELQADGFLKSFAGLELMIPEGIRMHDAQEDLSVDRDGEKLVSRYVVEKVLVPTVEGEVSLPPVSVTYFDPIAGRFETARSALAPLQVLPSDLPVRGDEPASFARSEIERLGKDLAFIHQAPARLRRRVAPLLTTPLGWAAILAPLLLLAAWKWQLSRLERSLRDPLGARRRNALSQARRRLKAANAQEDRGPALTMIAHAITGYVADREGRLPAAIGAAEVRRYAEDLGCRAEGEQLNVLLSLCDGQRFSPEVSGDELALSEWVGRAGAALAALDRTASQKKSAVRRTGAATASGVALCLCLALQAPASAAPPAEMHGSDPARMLAEGNQAYTAGDLDTALSRYRAALQLGVHDAVLHYNLGNVYARQGELGRAIISYLRAKRLSPRDQDIRANLSWVRSHIRDLELSGGQLPPLIAPVVGVVNAFSLEEWSITGIVLLWLVCGLIGLSWYRGGLTDVMRRFLLIAGSLLFLAAIVVGWRWYQEEGRRLAVIVASEVEVRSGPAQSFPVVFRVHDGLTLTIRGEREGWSRIGLGGEWVGWVPEESLEAVRWPPSASPDRSDGRGEAVGRPS